MTLTGRRAAVTGASRGIGRATALALAQAGAQVALLGRHAPALSRVAQDIQARGGQATPIVCDVTDLPALHAAFETVGELDILVNNAGTNHPEPFLEVTPERYDQIFGLNVRAAFFAAQLAARGMVARGSGVIVNVSSQMGFVGAPERSVYCASKHALEGLTKALAVELAPRGVRVVSVAPTFVETDFTAAMLADPAFRADVLARIPLGQLGRPEDVADAVVFLASDAARLVTGSSLKLDGGWTAR